MRDIAPRYRVQNNHRHARFFLIILSIHRTHPPLVKLDCRRVGTPTYAMMACGHAHIRGSSRAATPTRLLRGTVLPTMLAKIPKNSFDGNQALQRLMRDIAPRYRVQNNHRHARFFLIILSILIHRTHPPLVNTRLQACGHAHIR